MLFCDKAKRRELCDRLSEVESRLLMLECSHDCTDIVRLRDEWYGMFLGLPVGEIKCCLCGKVLQKFYSEAEFLAARQKDDAAKLKELQKRSKK